MKSITLLLPYYLFLLLSFMEPLLATPSSLPSSFILDLTAHHDLKYENLVDVKVGDHLIIKIKENPTTGYVWELYEPSLVRNGLGGAIKLAESTYQ